MKKPDEYLGLKLATILLAMLFPIITLIIVGRVNSFSSTWNTELQPIFIFTNATTSYFLFFANKWRLPAFLLLLLTCVSVEFSREIHDLLALLFFVSCLRPMYSINRLKIYFYLYLITIPLAFMFELFWFETIAVWILCAYHLNYIHIINNLKN